MNIADYERALARAIERDTQLTDAEYAAARAVRHGRRRRPPRGAARGTTITVHGPAPLPFALFGGGPPPGAAGAASLIQAMSAASVAPLPRARGWYRRS